MKSFDVFFKITILVAFGSISYFLYRFFQENLTLQHKISQLESKIDTSGTTFSIDQQDSDKNDMQFNTALSSQLWEKLQKKLQDTVVQLHVTSSEKNILQPYRVPTQSQAAGSGFIINDHGEIITNAHVVNGATCIMVQIPSFGKHQFEVDLVGIMPEKDVALVRFRPDDITKIINALGRMPQFKLGDSDKVVRSQEILALGYPLGQQSLKSTTGVISGRESGMIQMSAPINPGSSGGPSINCAGEVIGINTAGVSSAQNIGYIIAINDLRNVLDLLREGGLVRKPYLGIYQAMATLDLVKSLGNPMPGGTYVVDVLCDSPLYEQLKPGDMVYEINGIPVDLYGEMKVDWSEDKITTAEYVSRLKKGQKVCMKIYRRGKPMTFECLFERKKCAPIRHVFTEYEDLEYEIVGGFVIMPLMMNHLSVLMSVATGLSKYADEKNQNKPALVITHVMPNSVAFKERLKLTGSILKTVNGIEVATLKDLRKAIKKTKNMISMETTDNILVALDLEKICKVEPELSRSQGYAITECMKALMKKCDPKK
ncbi:trypsin-like peptidase domain-containing protein [Candidatus Dependentiae bacterium]|nr:trypsin-like peptidase domain-containing protein [Candidatus Dependentiae bacterium]